MSKCDHPHEVWCQHCAPECGLGDLIGALCMDQPVYPCPDASQDVAMVAFAVEGLRRDNKRLRAAIESLIDAFEGAVREFEGRARGGGGQHIPFHGDFASIPPSGASAMQRWVRDLREALAGKWPGDCDKCGYSGYHAKCQTGYPG